MALLIANAAHKLDAYIDLLHDVYDRAVETTHATISLGEVDVIFTVNAEMVIPEIGIGGYAASRDTVSIYLDAEHEIDADELYYDVCHELNHAKRYESEGFGKTLFDSMIFEGVAIAYEAELSGGASFMARALSERTDTETLVAQVRDELDVEQFNHHEWFIYDKSGRLPRWAGYELGYYHVRMYMEKTGKKAAELVLEPAVNFRLV